MMLTANQSCLIILHGHCYTLQFQQNEGSCLKPACSDIELLLVVDRRRRGQSVIRSISISGLFPQLVMSGCDFIVVMKARRTSMLIMETEILYWWSGICRAVCIGG